MALTADQITKTDAVWNFYIKNDENFINASREYTSDELDTRRTNLIPVIMEYVNNYLEGSLPLENFKSQVDSINKKNRLWGFMAINGQMFFNMLTKTSQNSGIVDECNSVLKQVIPYPRNKEDFVKKLKEMENFVVGLAKYCQDLRGAPKVGSIPFFLSYFWQLQKPESIPVYYTSMVQALQDLDIWSPSKNIVDDYVQFYDLNHDLRKYLELKTGKQITLWQVEHAFWLHYLHLTEKIPPVIEKPIKRNEEIKKLPESYIPPVVAILPRLAANEPELSSLCKAQGKTIEKEFEERLAVLFGMLGFETVQLGQGKGRVPDGIAVSDVYRYGIIYDAKVREQGYVIGTDERAIKEYITNQTPKLRNRGINTLYFLVISSSFSGNPDNAIRSIKIETRINEVILIEVKALLLMLEAKLRNPGLDLGPFGLQRLFASSGVLTEIEVSEYLES